MNFSYKIIIFLFFAFPAQALDVFGHLDVEYDQFFQEIEGRNGSRAKYKADVETKSLVGKSWTVKYNPILWYDPESKAKGQRLFYDTHQGYVEYYKGVFSAKIGYQQVNWGVTESFDPAKVVHSYVLWDPLTWQPLAIPAIKLQSSWNNSTFTALLIPRKRKSLLPQAESRWLPTEVDIGTANQGGAGGNSYIFPDRPVFSYREGKEVDDARNMNFGFRYAESYGAFDSSFFYFRGAAPVPFTKIYATAAAITPIGGQNVITIAPDVGLEPIYFKQETTGWNFVYSNDHFILRYAGNYINAISEVSDQINIPAWSQANVVALEFNSFGGDLTWLFEYSHIDRAGNLGNTVTDISRLFDRALTAVLRYEFNDNWSAMGAFLKDNENNDEVYQANITGKLSQDVKLNISWIEIRAASRRSPLGAYNRNDRLQGRLSYYF